VKTVFTEKNIQREKGLFLIGFSRRDEGIGRWRRFQAEDEIKCFAAAKTAAIAPANSRRRRAGVSQRPVPGFAD
jgi:hypothetical protein